MQGWMCDMTRMRVTWPKKKTNECHDEKYRTYPPDTEDSVDCCLNIT